MKAEQEIDALLREAAQAQEPEYPYEELKALAIEALLTLKWALTKLDGVEMKKIPWPDQYE